MANDSCLRGHHSFLRVEGRYPLLSQPIITALNISRENNVKFRTKEQSIQEAKKKIALKETWLTYENKYRRTDKQQNPAAEEEHQ